jgi:hypothetical protein
MVSEPHLQRLDCEGLDQIPIEGVLGKLLSRLQQLEGGDLQVAAGARQLVGPAGTARGKESVSQSTRRSPVEQYIRRRQFANFIFDEPERSYCNNGYSEVSSKARNWIPTRHRTPFVKRREIYRDSETYPNTCGFQITGIQFDDGWENFLCEYCHVAFHVAFLISLYPIPRENI